MLILFFSHDKFHILNLYGFMEIIKCGCGCDSKVVKWCASICKFVPVPNYLSTTSWRRMEEWKCRSTFSWPWHWLEFSGQLHTLVSLPLDKEAPGPVGQEAAWIPELVWTIWQIDNSWPYWDSNSNSSVVQPIVSHYTSSATMKFWFPIFCL
jgi:hypothetical protein